MKVYATDGEGPVTKNDNAYELASQFIPGGDPTYEGVDGGRFFTVVSSYDDVLAYVVKRKGYKAGDTLRLILPFLRAFGADDGRVRDYSRGSIVVMPGVQGTLRFIRESLGSPSYIISTSYEHYVRAFCERIGFPFENAFSTRLRLDRYTIPKGERGRLKDLCREIAGMPVLEIPGEAGSLNDLTPEAQKAFSRLDEIFWEELPVMEAYRMVEEVDPMGGWGKARALEEVVEREEVGLSEVIYYGDSITDVEAFRLVNRGGGVSISFNGNLYAVREAQIAVLSYDTLPVSLLTEAFVKGGGGYVLELAEGWSRDNLRKSMLNPGLLERLTAYSEERFPEVYALEKNSVGEVARRSIIFRREVRGEKVGALG